MPFRRGLTPEDGVGSYRARVSLRAPEQNVRHGEPASADAMLPRAVRRAFCEARGEAKVRCRFRSSGMLPAAVALMREAEFFAG
jgi:hypothetical protein